MLFIEGRWEVSDGMSPEEYNKEVQRFIKELTENSNAYVNIKDLVNLLVDNDKYYNHKPWNLLQILANINLIVPVDYTPKEPLNQQGDPKFGYCPNCGTSIYQWLNKLVCNSCLQRLKWGE